MTTEQKQDAERPPLTPQPSVFFDILAEKDCKIRNRKIDELSSGRDSPNTGEVVNLLQCLAGSIYIDKSHIRTLKKLGEGGFAVVEKARLSAPGKEPEIVAIKTLKPGLIEDEIDLQELIQEANVLRKLKHRYIVDFKGIGSLETKSIRHMRNSVYFGEEYMAGGTLKHVLAKQMKNQAEQVYTARDAWRWCLQVAEALDYLHHCQPAVVHRDLKPENVLLTTSDTCISEARIADFGLHKRLNRVCEARVQSVRRMTHKGPVPISSADNASPEESKNSQSEATSTTIGSHLMERSESKKKSVTWNDEDEEFPAADANPHQGDGGSGVDQGFQTSSSPFEKGPGAKLKFGHGINTDALVNVEEGKQESSVENNDSLPDTTSAALSDDSTREVGQLSNTMDSMILQHSQQERKSAEKTETTFEGQQRGSSQMLELLANEDENSLEDCEVYSSVMHSLGLTGTAHMSGIVGSLMYMAPEVVRGQKYTEKVDVFAFGLIMFELFVGRLTIVKVLAKAPTPYLMERELERYAKKIAKGYREEIPSQWPDILAELVSSCWHQDPQQRPRMKEVISCLKEIDESGSLSKMELIFRNNLQNKESRKCCTIC